MDPWIGPAIVAAAITAIVTALGWFVSRQNERRLEAARRIERLIDLQTALRAEIRSYLHNVSQPDFQAAAQRRLADIAAEGDEPYAPFIPKAPPNVVFDAVVDELHVLPTQVIDPLILFYRQLAVIAALAEDLRSDSFAKLPGDRRVKLYRRYVDLNVYSAPLAQKALSVLSRSIRHARARNRRAKRTSMPQRQLKRTLNHMRSVLHDHARRFRGSVE